MFGNHKEYFSKKYRRRTYGLTMMCYMTFMSAVRHEQPIVEDDQTYRYRDSRPFAPYTEVIDEDTVKITWLPVAFQANLHGFYELWNNEQLEYRGQDLTHVAKRLQKNIEYKFRLRVCSYTPDDCSMFSIPRYQTIYEEKNENFVYKMLKKLQASVPFISFFSAFAMTALVVWVFIIDVINFFSGFGESIEPCHDFINTKRKHMSKKDRRCTKSLACFIKLCGGTQREQLHRKRGKDVSLENISEEKLLEDRNNNASKTETKEKPIEIRKRIPHSTTPKTEQQEKDICHRGRSKSVDFGSNNITPSKDRSSSDSEVCHERKQQLKCATKTSSVVTHSQKSNIVVVIDNSNIFIGARETACKKDTALRARHVKLRINQLLQLLQNGRKVTRGITGASTPGNTSENVWDIYRRAGFEVDLEERRGKDEQRVDEQLHLAIYKVLDEYPPQTLVLATGDGHKGKSKFGSSFIQCAKRALDQGWKVELCSWKNCLSISWLKLATQNENITIKYLDQHIEKLTITEKKQLKIGPGTCH